MRTTIEITDAQRAKLLELAALRGEKGFSHLVQEAIDVYVESQAAAKRAERVKTAISVLGSLDERVARAMEASAREFRSSWR